MKKKRIIITISVLVLIILSFVGMLTANSYIEKSGPQKYLAKKYNIKQSEIQIVSYNNNHLEINFDLDSSDVFRYINRQWICEYNGRTFNVEYYLFHFMDDYQLEELFNWCTEYLQQNVDKDIVGVEIYSDIIYHSNNYDFDYLLPWDDKKIFSKNDAKEFLDVQLKHHYGIEIYYPIENFEEYSSDDSTKEPNANNNEFESQIKNNKLLDNKKYHIKLITKPYFERVDYRFYPTNMRCNALVKYSLSEKCVTEKVKG